MDYRALALLRLDIGLSDHLGPLLGLVADKIAEFGGRHRQQHFTQVGKLRVQLGIA